MTSRLFHFLWLTIALLCGTVLADDEIRWAPDIAQARKASAQFKVPLLIHFHGDNCLPCKTLEQRVLSQAEVIQALNKYFICVRVNATQDRRVAAEFQVHSWPTDVFVSPDGKTLYQGVCQQDVRSYVSVLENVAVMNRDRNIMLAAAKPTQPAGSIAQQTAPVGDGRMMAPQLPPPGANQITSSQTPSFYAGPTDSQSQQLQVSKSPAAGVQSGPLLASGQPNSITGSTPAYQQQLSAPTAPEFNVAAQGMLPPRSTPVAQVQAPVDLRKQSNELVGYPQVPSMPGRESAMSAPNQQLVSVNQPGEMVANPYFPQPAKQPIVNQVASQPAPSNLVANRQDFANQVASNQSATPKFAEAEQPNTIASEPPQTEPSVLSAHTVSFQPRAASKPTEMAAPTVAAKKPAMEGYCPIALKSNAEWIEGDPRYAVKHRGKVYWLSSQAALEEFMKSPDSASPVLSGYDPMIFLTEGRLVNGDIQFGLHEEIGGSILFFASEESKKQYEADYDRNSRALSVIVKQAAAR